MGDCGVCIGSDYGDCESPEFFTIRYQRARKEHRCGECGVAIPPNQVYQICTGKIDGEFWSEKTCSLCAEIRGAFACEGWPMFGEMWADIKEALFPRITQACFDRLTTPEAKTYLREQWMKWKGLQP